MKHNTKVVVLMIHEIFNDHWWRLCTIMISTVGCNKWVLCTEHIASKTCKNWSKIKIKSTLLTHYVGIVKYKSDSSLLNCLKSKTILSKENTMFGNVIDTPNAVEPALKDYWLQKFNLLKQAVSYIQVQLCWNVGHCVGNMWSFRAGGITSMTLSLWWTVSRARY